MTHLPVLRGFTLIEMMISIALGSLILIAAMAGFRTGAQTITVANRLSLENSMLRAGFQAALNEVDTWTAYDDPDSKDPADQALRKVQLPFSPLPKLVQAPNASQSTGSGTTSGAQAQGQYLYPTPEGDTGWDSAYFWPPNDPRTWWRANAAEWNNTAGRSGSYALFANTAGAPHTWLFTQMQMLQTNLGFYAFCDYLPPSMPYAYIANGDLDPLFVSPGDFRNGDGGTWFPQGRYRCTKNTSYILVPLKPVGGAGQIVAKNFRSIYTTGVDANQGNVTDLLNKATSTQPLLVQQPTHWPQMRVEVARFLCYNRFVALSTIKWTNTITGEPIALSFTAMGTTLRGARMMRKPGNAGVANGWAKWYAVGSSKNDPNIDTPLP